MHGSFPGTPHPETQPCDLTRCSLGEEAAYFLSANLNDTTQHDNLYENASEEQTTQLAEGEREVFISRSLREFPPGPRSLRPSQACPIGEARKRAKNDAMQYDNVGAMLVQTQTK